MAGEVRRFELSAWNAIVGLGTGERFVRASDYDALAARLAASENGKAWAERELAAVRAFGTRIVQNARPASREGEHE
jgi:hypothetical protein